MISLPGWGATPVNPLHPELPAYEGLLNCCPVPWMAKQQDSLTVMCKAEQGYRTLSPERQAEDDHKRMEKLMKVPALMFQLASQILGTRGFSMLMVGTFEAWALLSYLNGTHPQKSKMSIYTLFFLRAVKRRRVTLADLLNTWSGQQPCEPCMKKAWIAQRGHNGDGLDQPQWWDQIAKVIKAETPEPEPDIMHYPIIP